TRSATDELSGFTIIGAPKARPETFRLPVTSGRRVVVSYARIAGTDRAGRASDGDASERPRRSTLGPSLTSTGRLFITNAHGELLGQEYKSTSSVSAVAWDGLHADRI